MADLLFDLFGINQTCKSFVNFYLSTADAKSKADKQEVNNTVKLPLQDKLVYSTHYEHIR